MYYAMTYYTPKIGNRKTLVQPYESNEKRNELKTAKSNILFKYYLNDLHNHNHMTKSKWLLKLWNSRHLPAETPSEMFPANEIS